MFQEHPRGLPILFFTEMWERFSYYGMRALLIFYMTKHFLMSDDRAYILYGSYTALVYAMPVIGGMIADRYLGARKSVTIGAILLSLGHLMMAIEGEPAHELFLADGTRQIVQDPLGLQAFFLALALIIVGVGFLKPNISVLVGKLYPANDPRVDSGFTLFYMGINIGALSAALACGYIGENYGWSYGFGLAGIGMLTGLFTFLRGQKHLGGHAEPPDPDYLQRPLVAGLSLERWIWVGAVAAIAVIWQLIQFDWVVNSLLVAIAIAVVIWFVAYSFLSCGRQDRNNMLIMLLLIASSVLFWSLFEQAGSSLSLYTERVVDRNIFGFEIAPGQFQSVNPAFIILLAPLFAFLWVKAEKAGLTFINLPAKFALGILQVGLGFAVLVFGAQYPDQSGKVSMIWLILAYFLHTTGELCLSPVGLSMVTKLSVKRVISLVMGIWFLSSAFAANLGGLIARATSLNTEGGGTLEGIEALNQYSSVFSNLALVAVVCGFLLLIASPWLNRRISIQNFSRPDRTDASVLEQQATR